MTGSPVRDLTGEADERFPARRLASEPAPGGEALVEHLVDRLATVEQDLRVTRASADVATAERALLGRAARQLATIAAPVSELVRLALPALGDWCILETLSGERGIRCVVAAEHARESAAAGLADTLDVASGSDIAITRLRSSGRIERLQSMPDQPALGMPASRALQALGDGPVLMVPVHAGGCLVAAMIFGRTDDATPYGAASHRLAEEFAAFVALAVKQERAAAAVEEAARAKAEFLTMMSHELRTPLNAIAGYAQLLEMGFRGPLNDEQREAVERILRGQEHLLELVDAVLTFSRLTGGGLVLQPVEISAAGLLQVASEPLARDFAERDIALETRECPSGLRVLGDHERAPEVLRHLLSNALKFTSPGGRVLLACECDELAVRFVVSDTGRGIPASQVEAIFQPFVQAERGHTRSVDGSGLGLAIGRELAERMGGSLSVTSEVGVGSRFVLTLRRAGEGQGSGTSDPDRIDTASGQG